jgi:hypothetical protein
MLWVRWWTFGILCQWISFVTFLICRTFFHIDTDIYRIFVFLSNVCSTSCFWNISLCLPHKVLVTFSRELLNANSKHQTSSKLTLRLAVLWAVVPCSLADHSATSPKTDIFKLVIVRTWNHIIHFGRSEGPPQDQQWFLKCQTEVGLVQKWLYFMAATLSKRTSVMRCRFLGCGWLVGISLYGTCQ